MGFVDNLTVADCWVALHLVNNSSSWIKLNAMHHLTSSCRPGSDDDCGAEAAREQDTNHIDVYVHYNNQLNGFLHVLVPGLLPIFGLPADPGRCGRTLTGAAVQSGLLRRHPSPDS